MRHFKTLLFLACCTFYLPVQAQLMKKLKDKANAAAEKIMDKKIHEKAEEVTGVNALLSIPFVAGAGDSKVVRIAGYKALVSKVDAGGSSNYDLQLPLNNSLITLRSPALSPDQVFKLANALPVQEIAKMLQ